MGCGTTGDSQLRKLYIQLSSERPKEAHATKGMPTTDNRGRRRLARTSDPRWRVDIRGKESQNLGTVDAPNAWEALARAVELLDTARPFVARPPSPAHERMLFLAVSLRH